MNYKEVLTEEAATQFKKEGATFVLLSIFNQKDLIRDLEVSLEDSDRVFCIAGKNSRAEAGLAKEFTGQPVDSVDGKVWYPFHTVYLLGGSVPDIVLRDVADYLKIEATELEWAFMLSQST